MLNAKVVISGIFIVSLMGCGGGGGDTPPASIPEDETPVIEDPVTVLPEEASVAISELKASEDFTFTSKEEVEVSLDLANEVDTDTRAYVSVYSDYTLLDSGDFYANGSSRVVSGSLEDGQFSSAFISLDGQDTYLIEIAYYTGEAPLQKEQTVTDNSLTW